MSLSIFFEFFLIWQQQTHNSKSNKRRYKHRIFRKQHRRHKALLLRTLIIIWCSEHTAEKCCNPFHLNLRILCQELLYREDSRIIYLKEKKSKIQLDSVGNILCWFQNYSFDMTIGRYQINFSTYRNWNY